MEDDTNAPATIRAQGRKKIARNQAENRPNRQSPRLIVCLFDCLFVCFN